MRLLWRLVLAVAIVWVTVGYWRGDLELPWWLVGVMLTAMALVNVVDAIEAWFERYG